MLFVCLVSSLFGRVRSFVCGVVPLLIFVPAFVAAVGGSRGLCRVYFWSLFSTVTVVVVFCLLPLLACMRRRSVVGERLTLQHWFPPRCLAMPVWHPAGRRVFGWVFGVTYFCRGWTKGYS